MKSNFNNGFQSLNCDEDVLLFTYDITYTVGLFAELILEKIRANVCDNARVIGIVRSGILVNNKVPFELFESQWESSTEELECQLLGVGYSGWKKGKLRIKTDVDFRYQNPDFTAPVISARQLELAGIIIKIDLEFSPDEPNEYQSPLDKLRQLESDL